jgi:hypothetical protein
MLFDVIRIAQTSFASAVYTKTHPEKSGVNVEKF